MDIKELLPLAALVLLWLPAAFLIAALFNRNSRQ